MYTQRSDSFARRLVLFEANPPAEGSDDTIVIPDDLTTLDDAALAALHEQAVTAFDALFGDGTGLSDETVTALTSLTEGIEAIDAETTNRETATVQRTEAAAALAARIHPQDGGSDAHPDIDDDPGEDDTGDNDGENVDAAPVVADEAPQAIAASGQDRRISLRGARSRAPRQARPAATQQRTMSDLVFAAGDTIATGMTPGAGLTWDQMASGLSRRLGSFNSQAFAAANRSGRHMREQHSLAVFRKPFTNDLRVSSDSQEEADAVIRHATDQSRLPQGNLVASGGWCAPSEVLYDLCEPESRDGLISLPEIDVTRGGIRWTPGPSFSDIYSNIGFHFTEADDAAVPPRYAPNPTPGGPNVAGTKPCYKIECPPFDEARLEADGLCITAGLLQSRAYPEVLQRVLRGALVAHDHKVSAGVIQSLVDGSTPVVMPTGTVGTTSPVLTAIELQVEHMRYTNRGPRTQTMEGVFPFWIRGAIRSDLSYRLGIDLLDVTNEQIDAWFRRRGVAPQYVYDWQALDVSDPATFTQWPDEVQFLLYGAGTWVKGTSDIITLDTVYDSTQLANNDFTALFTEEAWLTAKICDDSRVITVEVCSDGSTHAGILIECDGTETPAAP